MVIQGLTSTLSFKILIGTVLLLFCGKLHAAPVPPAGPFNVEGTITELNWTPEAKVKGKPGMSGTLGFDRVVPAYFLVKLTDYKGVDPKALKIMKGYYQHASEEKDSEGKPLNLVLRLNHFNKDFLKRGMRIKVMDYKIMGDEGGDWSYYKEIQIIPLP